MEIRGTPSETGDTYTIAVTAKRSWARKLIMRLLLFRNKREILSRFETYDYTSSERYTTTAHVVLKLDC